MPNGRQRAQAAVEGFLSTIPGDSTRSLRRTYLEEYLAFLAELSQCAGRDLTIADLLEPAHADAWLLAATRGTTRRRTGRSGPRTPASANAMAARTTTLNTFSRALGSPLNLTVPKREFAPRLSPTEAHRTLRLLAGHQPAQMLPPTWQRTTALIALALATGYGLPDLHTLRAHDLDLDRTPARARVRGDWFPLDTLSRALLEQWLTTRRDLTTHLDGGAVEELWVTTKPGRPRAGRPAPPPGLPAKRRSLESAHRKLTLHALGTPLLIEQFCAHPPERV